MNTTPSIDKEATIANVLIAASRASATTSFDKAKFDQKMEQENWAEILVDIAKALRAEVIYVNEEISV
jgi:hypothetical protein